MDKDEQLFPAPTSGRLYNCCTGEVAPDWSTFVSLEVGGCITGDEGQTTGGIPDHEAEFWTVYGRLHDGCAEAITDCRTKSDAVEVLGELARLSGLPVTP